MTLEYVSRWTGGEGDNYVDEIVSDGTYLYVNLDMEPSTVVKISMATMAEAGRWTDVESEMTGVYSLVHDGTNLYAGFRKSGVTGIATVLKIDPATMTETDRWTDEDWWMVEAIAYDDAYVYAVTKTFDGVNCVFKIDKSNMTTADSWVSDDQHDGGMFHAIASGTDLFITAYDNPGIAYPKLIQLNTATMTETARWEEGETASAVPYGMAFDGSHVYLGCDTEPGTIYKLDPYTVPGTISVADMWTGAEGEDDSDSLHFGGTYLLATLYLEASVVVLCIDVATMTEVDRWTSETDAWAWGVWGDGTYVYAGVNEEPGEVVKLSAGGGTSQMMSGNNALKLMNIGAL